MGIERYPADVPIRLDDLKRCGLEDILTQAENFSFDRLWDVLSKSAKGAIDAGRVSEGKVLWLFADACSMMLLPAKANDPYRPLCTTLTGRSAIVSDFSNDEIDFFALVSEHVEDARIRSRISDIVWLVNRPRSPKFALIAIDAYKQIPIDIESWIHNGRECWERAVQLALLLGGATTTHLEQLRVLLLDAFRRSDHTNGLLLIWVADVLSKTGVENPVANEIAEKLEKLASYFDDQAIYDTAQANYDAADKWYVASSEVDKSILMRIRSAETFVKRAECVGYAISANFYEQAIHLYRRVPTKRRRTYSVDQRINELHQRMTEAAKNSLSEMKVIRHQFDLDRIVQQSIKAVAGKKPLDALQSFATLYLGTRVVTLRQQAMEALKTHPLSSLISKTMFSRDGRIIARTPGVSPSEDLAENERAVWAEMVKHHGLKMAIVVQGEIWPAFEILAQEHHFTERDMITIAANSPLVPNDRALIVGRGLSAGFDKDFISAIHLLVPQIENIVRWHLKLANVRTTTLDSNGIEMEVGLSALIDKEELKSIFGVDIVFELRAIFADTLGPNLRNEIAHGLLGTEEAQSIYVIYAWWWCFKLVFNTFLNSQERETENRPEGHQSQGTDEP